MATRIQPAGPVEYRGQPVVLDAPQIASATGKADKIAAIPRRQATVSYRETDGCYDNECVHYAPSTPEPPRTARANRSSPAQTGIRARPPPSGFIVNCPVVSFDVNACCWTARP
jgi:hypothetical protein